MIVKGIIDENFTDYKVPSLQVIMPKCTMKCGRKVCQNSKLLKSPNADISPQSIIDRYMTNNVTHALLFSGLEPFDSFLSLNKLVHLFREWTCDDIVIYSGYDEMEIEKEIYTLQQYNDIYVKFGRFLPNQEKHYDEVLGVYLASSNQYGKKIS